MAPIRHFGSPAAIACIREQGAKVFASHWDILMLAPWLHAAINKSACASPETGMPARISISPTGPSRALRRRRRKPSSSIFHTAYTTWAKLI